MGKSTLYIFRWFAAAILTLSACSKYDDPVDNDGILTDYGIMNKMGLVAEDYFIERDDGALLFMSNSALNDDIADKRRVKFYYQIDSQPVGSRMTIMNTASVYYITLYAIVEVPVRKMVMRSAITSGEESALGDDPLERVMRLFFSGGYLNMEYRIVANEEGFHNLNLVVDDTAENTDNEITLYIRYNDDAAGPGAISSNLSDRESEVSFDIRELIPEEDIPLKINIMWREAGKGMVKKTGTYRLDPLSYTQIVGR